MGDPSYKPEDIKDAMTPVALTMPKAPAPKPPVAIDDRVPTPGEILDPVRPSFQGAEPYVIVDSVFDLVKDLYDKVFFQELDDLKPRLAEVQPREEHDGWVVKLIAFAAEAIATATLGKLGGLAAAKLFSSSAEAAGEAAETSIAGEIAAEAGKDGGKAAGKKAGAAIEEHLGTAEAGEERPNAFSNKLVDEFVAVQRGHLLVKKHDAIDRLRLLRARAASVNGASMAALDENLKGLLEDGKVRNWFRTKVTLEWSNLLARMSLGHRPKGQATNMPGANASGGWHDAGARGTAQWRGAHDGVVDITVAVDDAGTTSFVDARLSNRPGAAEILRGLGADSQSSGTDIKLGTMAAFRRVWLKAGETRLGVNPAFVITPEGALEVNYDDPILALVGGARGLGDALPYDAYDGRDPTERAQRAVRTTYAMAGATKIVTLLASTRMEKLQ